MSVPLEQLTMMNKIIIIIKHVPYLSILQNNFCFKKVKQVIGSLIICIIKDVIDSARGHHYKGLQK